MLARSPATAPRDDDAKALPWRLRAPAPGQRLVSSSGPRRLLAADPLGRVSVVGPGLHFAVGSTSDLYRWRVGNVCLRESFPERYATLPKRSAGGGVRRRSSRWRSRPGDGSTSARRPLRQRHELDFASRLPSRQSRFRAASRVSAL